jgi:anti-sigma-K factor RskA
VRERRDITTDDVIQRLQELPRDAWDPPHAPPLRIDVVAPPDAVAARRRERWAWLKGSLTLRPLTAGALASVLLLVGVAGGILLGGGDPSPVPGEQVQLAALPGAPGATATAALGGDLDGMELKVSGLPASQPGEYYELWALNSPDDLAPIGTFRVGGDGQADVQFALGIDPAKYKALDVSVEREDGDPGHSGDSLLRSEISTA